MTPLRQAAEEYLAMRRALGFKLITQGRHLMRFVEFCEARGAGHVTTGLALAWATQTSRGSSDEVYWSRRLMVVRIFGVCQIFCARDFFLSGTRCLSGTLSSRYLMSLCPFYSAGPGNRTFRAVPGLMLRVPVFFPSCSFRAPLPCPCRITWRLLPCVT